MKSKKSFLAVLVLALGGALAYGAGNTNPELQASKVKNGTGSLVINSSGVITSPNSTGTLALTNGNVATATALAVDPVGCSAGNFVTDMAADGTLTCALGAGDFSGPASSVDSQLVIFNGATGKVGKAAASTGRPKLTVGVLSVGAIDLATEVTGNLPVTNLNSGTSASATTFWKGSGVWSNVDLSTAAVTGVLPNANTTGVSAPTVSTLVLRDASGNTRANGFTQGYATTATAAGTTTLTVSSARIQFFTGATTQSVVLPAANTLAQTGDQFEIHNNSSGIVTVKDNGSNTILAQPGLSTTIYTVTNIGSANGSWDASAGSASPLTTKGDIFTYSTTGARQGVPGDYGQMIPDTGATNGWRNATYSQIQQGRPGKNYVQYSDFENNATTGWTASGCATVTNGLPACNGSGGTAFSSANGGRAKGANTNSPAINSSSSIAGTYALNYATTGAGVIGDGYVSSLLPIDPADQAKILSYKLYFKVASGTPVMAGTATDTYAVAIYDPVNNSFIPVTGAFSFTQSSGIGIAQGSFQTAITTTSVQLFLYSPVAPTGTSSLLIDDVYIGPQALAFGAAMADEKAVTVTPNGFGTPTATQAWASRHGNTAHFRGFFTAGTVSATIASLSLPAGYVIDSSLMPVTAKQWIGTHNQIRTAAGPATSPPFAVFYDGSDTAKVYFAFQTGSDVFTKVAGNAFTGTGDTNAFDFWVPIAGWSSNTVQSADSDTRVVAARYSLNANQSIPHNTLTVVAWDTKTYDTHSMCSGLGTTSFSCTIPVTGKYRVTSALFTASSAWTLGQASDIYVYKNGSIYSLVSDVAWASTTASLTTKIADTADFVAGDTVNIRYDQNRGSATNISGASDGRAYFAIERISGPSVINASEKVYAFYTGNAGTVLAANSTNLDWTTKVADSHSAWNGTTFTAPRPGFCTFSGSAFTTAGVTATLSFYTNATIKQALGGGASARTFDFAFGYFLNTGDAVTIRSDTIATLSNSATLHWISVLCP